MTGSGSGDFSIWGSLQLPAGQAFVAFLIMILDVEPGRDVDELAADEGLPDTLHQGATPVAKTVAVGELVDDLLMGEGGQVGFPPALLLLPAGIAGDGFIQGGFLDFGVSLCLGFVEKEGDLVLIDDGFRPFGLPPVKLPGQGGDLVGQAHQFRSQFFKFFLEGLVSWIRRSLSAISCSFSFLSRTFRFASVIKKSPVCLMALLYHLTQGLGSPDAFVSGISCLFFY